MAQVAAGLGVLDADWFIVRFSVLHFRREGGAGSELETGGELRAWRLVCVRGAVHSGRVARAAISI